MNKKSIILLVIVAIVAFFAGGAFYSKGPVSGPKVVSPESAAANHKLPVACHPDDGDLAHDGSKFAAIGPDRKTLTISYFTGDERQSVIKLPIPAVDVLLLGDKQAILSQGPSGEVSLVDLDTEQVGKLTKIGESAGKMCRVGANLALVSDG